MKSETGEREQKAANRADHLKCLTAIWMEIEWVGERCGGGEPNKKNENLWSFTVGISDAKTKREEF